MIVRIIKPELLKLKSREKKKRIVDLVEEYQTGLIIKLFMVVLIKVMLGQVNENMTAEKKRKRGINNKPFTYLTKLNIGKSVNIRLFYIYK